MPEQKLLMGLRRSLILSGHEDDIRSLIQLRDGRLVTTSDDEMLRLWTLKPDGTYSSLKLVGHLALIGSVIELQDGRLLSVSEDETMLLWTLKGKSYTVEEFAKDISWLTQVIQLPSGEVVTASGGQGTLMLWDLQSREGKPLATLKGHTRFVQDMFVLRDGRIVSASGDGNLKIWKRESPLKFSSMTLKGHQDTVTAVVELQDGRLLSSSFDQTLRLWTPGTNGKYTSKVIGPFSRLIFSVRELVNGDVIFGMGKRNDDHQSPETIFYGSRQEDGSFRFGELRGSRNQKNPKALLELKDHRLAISHGEDIDIMELDYADAENGETP